jgi:uncharacterized UBP type Zn finger protein
MKFDYLLNEKSQNKEKKVYNLSAIVVHVGSGIEYGHYYSLIKVSENKWYKCDDENIHVRFFL